MKIVLVIFFSIFVFNPILSQSIEVRRDTTCETLRFEDGSKSFGCYFMRNDSNIKVGDWEYSDSNNIVLLKRNFVNGIIKAEKYLDKKGRLKKQRIYSDTIVVEKFRKNGSIRKRELHSNFESGYSSNAIVYGFRNSGSISSKSLFINRTRKHFSRFRINGTIEREISINESNTKKITKVFNRKGKCTYQNELTKRTLENGRTIWVDEDMTLRDQWKAYGYIGVIAGLTPLISLIL
jgi:hypothetical protein